MSDFITILKTLDGKRLAKRWAAADRPDGYEKAYLYKATSKAVSSLAELSVVLEKLRLSPVHAVIRGEPKDSTNLERTTRDGNQFQDDKHNWIMLDVDGWTPPEGVDPHSQDAIEEWIEAHLPDEFHGVDYYWHMSGSAGHPYCSGELRCHIWFWSKTAYNCDDLKAWAESLSLPVDTGVFQTVQLHYTSDPVLELDANGQQWVDPIAVRSGMHTGWLELPEVDLIIDPGILSRARTSRAARKSNLVDPRTKNSIIGAFHRAYTVEEVIDDFLPGEFTWVTDRRLTWHRSSKGDPEGIYVTDDRMHVGSTHGSDPANGRLVNLWDLVRLYRFGDLDRELDDFERLNVASTPSQAAMIDLVKDDPRVLAELVDPIPQQTPAGQVILDKENVMGAARDVLESRYTTHEGLLLRRLNGTWYRYCGTHYNSVDDEIVRQVVWDRLDSILKRGRQGPLPYMPSMGQVTSTLDAMKGLALLDCKNPPCWMPGFSGADPKELVALSNGLFDLRTRTLYEHTQGFFTTNALPFAWYEDAQCPEWHQFLQSVWPDDQESIDTLQEMMGYLLTGDTSLQKMFMLIGPKRSGKGTIGRIIKAIIGPENISGPTMASLTTQFGLQPLIDKLVALIADARGGSEHRQTIVERLLMISGEDAITVDRKNMDAWTGQMRARVVILSNEMLQLGDASGALVGRMVVLRMGRSFYGKEDTKLTERLLQELPGIFQWAVEGRARLFKRGFFVQPASGQVLVDEMNEMNNPAGEFLHKYCESDPSGRVEKDLLYEAWKIWCSRNGRHPGTKEAMSKAIFAADFKIGKTRGSESGGRAHFYTGIKLKDDVERKVREICFFDDSDDEIL